MIIIGTIENKLATAHAQYLQDEISKHEVDSEIVVAKTSANENQGIGKVMDELNRSLLNNEIDVVVYPMEYLTTKKIEGLQIAGLSERKSANELILSTDSSILNEGPLTLKDGSKVAVNSDLREELLAYYFPTSVAIRTELDLESRINGLKSGQYDYLITDKASIEWLNYNIEGLYARELSPREFIPAPAQGVLAYQCRTEDQNLRQLLARIHHAEVSELTNVERSVLMELEGKADFVLGVHCEPSGLNYRTHAAYKEKGSDEMRVVRALHISTSELANAILSQLNAVETDA